MEKFALLTRAVILGLFCTGMQHTSFIQNVQAEELAKHIFEPIIVNGNIYYAEGYMSETARVGMMSNKSTMEIPHNTMSVTSKVIEDFALSGNNEMMDVLAFSPSVRRTTSADLVAIRGKQVSAQQMNINGINGLYSNFSTGLNFVEKVDITSGPALLYTGSNSQNVVGGTVGLQSKRAGDVPIANAEIKFTGRGNLQESIDFGQRFGRNNSWGVRVNSLNRSGNLAVYDEKLTQRNIFVNIDHTDTRSNTNFLTGYAYSKHNGGNSIFQPAANGHPEQMAYLPKAPMGSHNMNPGWAVKKSKTWLFALNHDQKINNNWSVFLNTGLMKNEVPMNISGSAMTQTFDFSDVFDGKFKRPLTLSASASTKRYIGVGVKSEYDLGNVKNEFIIGVDKSFVKNWTSDFKKLGTFIGNLYGDNTWPSPDLSEPGVRLRNRHTTSGFTVIDSMKFFNDKLILSAGLHHHKYQAESYNTTGKVSSNQTYDGNCPTYGFIYKFTPDIMFYANHSETFLGGTQVSNTSGYANAGELLEPAKTKSNEVGFKIKTGNLLNTISLYQTKEPGTMVVDNVYGYFGETKYKGVEVSSTGTIGKKWNMMGSIGYCRYIWEKNSNSKLNGLTANGIPKWNANLALVYKPDDKVSILGRMSYIGTSHIHYGAFEVPSNTRFDLGTKYKTKMNGKPVIISAMCYNMFNKKAWYSADQGNQLLIGEPRTFVLSAKFEF